MAKHCWHDVGVSQLDDRQRCCWCGQLDWEQVDGPPRGHGPFFPGGGVADRRNEECEVRSRER